jgi:DinB superfamily
MLVARTREELTADLDQLDVSYGGLVQNCSSEQLNWRPAVDSWSIAQCIQHVARVNSVYLVPIKATITRARAGSTPNQEVLRTAGWFSAYFLKSVSPEGKVKLPAPRVARPAAEPSTVNVREALRMLQNTHQQIREILTQPNQPHLNRIRFKNPFLPVLRFTVGTGILIMAAHGRRHLLQAQRICQLDNFPATQSIGRPA